MNALVSLNFFPFISILPKVDSFSLFFSILWFFFWQSFFIRMFMAHNLQLFSLILYLKMRVSAIISNAPYLLNVDCDHYINNSKAIRESMCFMMDPTSGKKICYVQFPQRFDGIDRHDRYSNRNVVFFDVSI